MANYRPVDVLRDDQDERCRGLTQAALQARSVEQPESDVESLAEVPFAIAVNFACMDDDSEPELTPAPLLRTFQTRVPVGQEGHQRGDQRIEQ